MQPAWGLVGIALLALPLATDARGGGRGSSHSNGHSTSHSSRATHSSGATSGGHGTAPKTSSTTHSAHAHPTKAAGVTREKHGRINRSAQAKHDFQKSHPCPSTGRSSGACPGYVVDHVTPLKRGGADHPSNMQWQTEQEAKIKDRSE